MINKYHLVQWGGMKQNVPFPVKALYMMKKILLIDGGITFNRNKVLKNIPSLMEEKIPQ